MIENEAEMVATIARLAGSGLLLALLGAGATQPATRPAKPIVWQTAGIGSARALDLNRYQADRGMIAAAKDGTLELKVSGVPFSNVLLHDRIDYREAGVLRLEIGPVHNGDMTLQAVCLDEQGQTIAEVNLMDNFTDGGTYEVPLRIYRTPMRGTRQIALKIWLGGEEATAKVISVWYGRK